MTWKNLCDRHSYRRLSTSSSGPNHASIDRLPPIYPRPSPYTLAPLPDTSSRLYDQYFPGPSTSAPNLSLRNFDAVGESATPRRRKAISYKSHFKQRYMVETAWRHGGRFKCRPIKPDQGVVTSLHLTPKYIVVALDNAKIHVFDTEGDNQKTLQGHIMGVWAMVPWGDILVSGGCDRDVRVWNMATGLVRSLSLGIKGITTNY
jgi:F-box and WD-40 domain protein CDC4